MAGLDQETLPMVVSTLEKYAHRRLTPQLSVWWRVEGTYVLTRAVLTGFPGDPRPAYGGVEHV
jgi:hypothetical protein